MPDKVGPGAPQIFVKESLRINEPAPMVPGDVG